MKSEIASVLEEKRIRDEALVESKRAYGERQRVLNIPETPTLSMDELLDLAQKRVNALARAKNLAILKGDPVG